MIASNVLYSTFGLMYLPLSAMGWSVICKDCDISLHVFFFFFFFFLRGGGGGVGLQ